MQFSKLKLCFHGKSTFCANFSTRKNATSHFGNHEIVNATVHASNKTIQGMVYTEP